MHWGLYHTSDPDYLWNRKVVSDDAMPGSYQKTHYSISSALDKSGGPSVNQRVPVKHPLIQNVDSMGSQWALSDATDCFTDLSNMGSARRLRSASIAAPRWIAALCT